MNAPLMMPNMMLASLRELVVSQSPVQVLRRQRFTQESLQELADSFGNGVGILEPLVVRTLGAGERTQLYEIVAGERRFLAAKIAGLDRVPCIVRDLDDSQALEVQMIENLQRNDFHALEEAAGFKEMMRLNKLSATQVGEKLGKSRSYIYGRTKLLDLCPEAQAAMQSGSLDASKGLLLARIPGPKLQKQALKILETDGQWYSFRRLMEKLRDSFMVRLDKAPFDLASEDLYPIDPKIIRTVMPHCGPCTGCPHNSANDAELQADLKLEPGAHVCTHVPCYDGKVQMHWANKRRDAERVGRTVIAGAAAKAVFPNRYNVFGHIDLDERPEDMDGPEDLSEEEQENWQPPTYREMFGKHLKSADVVLAEDPHAGGKLRELLTKKTARTLAKAAGVKIPAYELQDDKPDEERAPPVSNAQAEADRAKQQAKDQLEKDFRLALLQQVYAKWKGPLKRQDWRDIAELVEDQGYKGSDLLHILQLDLEKMTEAQLQVFCLAATMVDVLQYTHMTAKPLTDLAARLRIDPQKIKKDLQAKAKAAASGEMVPLVEKKAKKK